MALENTPHVVTYSDGEGSEAGVGIAIYRDNRKTLAGYMKVPKCVRNLWSRQMALGEHFDIHEIEAVGPALVMATWPDLLRNCLWTHYIDNENALASMIKGGSSVHSADCIAAYVGVQCAKLGVRPWFDRVDTKANPVDQLSRGKVSGDWKLVPVRFPAELRSALERYLDEPLPK